MKPSVIQLREQALLQANAGNDKVAMFLRGAADEIERLLAIINKPTVRPKVVMSDMCVGGPLDGYRNQQPSNSDVFRITLSQEDFSTVASSSDMSPDTVAYREYVYVKEFVAIQTIDGRTQYGYWRWNEHNALGSFEWLLKRFGDLTMLENRIVNHIGKRAVYSDLHHVVPDRR